MRGEELPGLSAFLRVGEEVFHTYSTYGRGIEEFHNGYQYLDLTAVGRQEEWEEPKGRAAPLGLQVGGPNMRLPDEYDTRHPFTGADLGQAERVTLHGDGTFLHAVVERRQKPTRSRRRTVSDKAGVGDG